MKIALYFQILTLNKSMNGNLGLLKVESEPHICGQLQVNNLQLLHSITRANDVIWYRY